MLLLFRCVCVLVLAWDCLIPHWLRVLRKDPPCVSFLPLSRESVFNHATTIPVCYTSTFTIVITTTTTTVNHHYIYCTTTFTLITFTTTSTTIHHRYQCLYRQSPTFFTIYITTSTTQSLPPSTTYTYIITIIFSIIISTFITNSSTQPTPLPPLLIHTTTLQH